MEAPEGVVITDFTVVDAGAVDVVFAVVVVVTAAGAGLIVVVVIVVAILVVVLVVVGVVVVDVEVVGVVVGLIVDVEVAVVVATRENVVTGSTQLGVYDQLVTVKYETQTVQVVPAGALGIIVRLIVPVHLLK